MLTYYLDRRDEEGVNSDRIGTCCQIGKVRTVPIMTDEDIHNNRYREPNRDFS
jgi:hypothetical protein